MDEIPIIGPPYNVSGSGRSRVSRAQTGRTIAHHFGWILSGAQVRRRKSLGGDLIADNVDDLAVAMRDLGWIVHGYPVWSDLPHLETRAADQVRRHIITHPWGS